MHAKQQHLHAATRQGLERLGAAFVSLLVTRLDAGKVKYYELWNEANGMGFYTGTQGRNSSRSRPLRTPSSSRSIPPPSWSRLRRAALSRARRLGSRAISRWSGAKYASACGAHGYPTYTLTPVSVSRATELAEVGLDPPDVSRVFARRATRIGLAGKPSRDVAKDRGGPTSTSPIRPSRLRGSRDTKSCRRAPRRASTSQPRTGIAWGPGTPSDYGSIANPDNSPSPAGVAFVEVYDWLVGASIAALHAEPPTD